jgi:2-C-methyl-D-erythritol 4-phosphate cytidylyltransferase/2-C-methyl-D-erythritol 2,4-cyclodiphosphate synthase
MNNYFIILASGQSKRFNSNKPKQFITYKNKALFEHSLDKAIISKLFKKSFLLLMIKNKSKKNIQKMF